MLGLLLPGCLVLLGQYAINYVGENKESLAFAPFVFWRKHSEYLLPKFLLSIVFPTIVYALYFGEARREAGLNLAWIVFGCSMLWAYLVIEAVHGPGSGNLSWSAEVGLFVLFCISTLFLLAHGQPGGLVNAQGMYPRH